MARIFKTKLYLCSDKDSNWSLIEEWEDKENGFCVNCESRYTPDELADPYCRGCGNPTELVNGFNMSDEAKSAFRYCLYEVGMDAEIDLDTGETWITHFQGVKLTEKVKVC